MDDIFAYLSLLYHLKTFLSFDSHLYMRMVIEVLERGGGNLLFSTPNLQDSSDCAKNRAPDRSWLVIDVRIWVWSKSRSELGDRVHQSWRLDFSLINYNGEIVSKSTSNSGFWGSFQLWCTVSPSSDGLFYQTQILSLITTHELSGARFLAQSEQSCKFWAKNKRLPPPSFKYFDNHPHNKSYEDGYWGIKPRGGNLLFRSQNLQVSSDCAKNRDPHRS